MEQVIEQKKVIGQTIETKTGTSVIHTIIAAIYAAVNEILNGGHFIPQNELQERILALASECKGDIGNLADVLLSKVSKDHNILNTLLKEHGFTIQLEPFGDDEMGVVSILCSKVEWRVEGKQTSLILPGGLFSAFRLDAKDHGLEFFRVSDYPHVIVRIPTKSGKEVICLTLADQALDGFALLDRVEKIRGGEHTQDYEYGSLLCPDVHLDQESDVSWFVGMQALDSNGGSWKVTQALQQTRFHMDYLGAEVKSAFAMSMVLECCMTPLKELVLDQPFFAWVERDGVLRPLFIGYIAPDSWVKK